ncbi:endonuclease NucS [Flavobacteriales bacterium]|jgi:restriction system protein|nr:endonuclease NucS [Flavobacteriales bacterium]
MKRYIRIMLGAKSVYANECFSGNFIGGDYGIKDDLTNNLSENWRDFNAKYRPVWLESHPGKSKVAAGLACGMLWTICKGINKGDIVLCPDGKGSYYVGTIESNYYYRPNEILPHRRKVKWYDNSIERSSMSKELQNSTGSIGTTSDVSNYSEEIENLISNNKPPKIVSNDATIEDPSVFALEKHLEDFLIQNWKNTSLGRNYDIYEEDGELVGQQYPSDTGPIDILAISKDKKTLLIVELKKGRVSDNVVGQIQRYMGYVKDELAEKNQTVKGVIIGFEDDVRIKRALSVTTNIEFFRYKVSFKLSKV